jgi:hypothetical protein
MAATGMRRATLECVAAFALGATVLVVPAVFEPVLYPAKFLPLIATAVERVSFVTLMVLAALGAGIGIAFRAPAFLLAICTVLVFPLWSIADIAHGGDHNLLPFEWLVYAFDVVLVLGSILIARTIKRHVAAGT